MKQIIFSLMLATAFTCQIVDSPAIYTTMVRCENDEVICYYFTGDYKGGMSCKFKENTDAD